MCALSLGAQQPVADSAGVKAVVPNLIRFSGSLRDANGHPLTGTRGVTFTLHADAQTNAALWIETQNVELDAAGHYSVLLGNTKAEGLPVDLFTSGEAHWLGVHVESLADAPRVLLVSVPYAMKAHDADTLSGMPASAFELRAKGGTSATTSKSAATVTTTALNVTTPGGSAFAVPVFDSKSDIVASTVTQTPHAVSVTDLDSHLNLLGSGDHHLSFMGDSNAMIGAGANGAYFYNLTPGSPLSFFVNNGGTQTEALYVAPNGNIGIGTGNPTANLSLVRPKAAASSLAPFLHIDNAYISAITPFPPNAIEVAWPYTFPIAAGLASPTRNVFQVDSNGAVRVRMNPLTPADMELHGSLESSALVVYGNNVAPFRGGSSFPAPYVPGAAAIVTNGGNGADALFAGNGLLAQGGNETGVGGWGGDGIDAVAGSGKAGFGAAARFRTGLSDVIIGNPGCPATSLQEFAAIGMGDFFSQQLSCANYFILNEKHSGNTTFNRPSGAYFVFQENATGSQLTIAPGGHVGIGTAIGSAPSNILTIQKGSGHAIADGWDVYSSARWKSNIQTLNDALAKVVQLRGVSYDYAPSQRHDIGMIAEEVGKVVPEVVTYDANLQDAQSIDYARLTAVLVEAVKEQQKEIEQLRAAVERLQNEKK